MKRELGFIARNFVPMKLLEPLIAYLDNFDAGLLNILVLSGYIAVFAEVLALR